MEGSPAGRVEAARRAAAGGGSELAASVTIGRVVLFRSRTGGYTVPAIVSATVDTLAARGVELGHVPALSSPEHVHLTVFTPGRPGMRDGAADFLVESEHGRGENVAGCYQEWDVPLDGSEAAPVAEVGVQGPGTWAWLVRS